MLNYLTSRSHRPSGWCWLFTGHVGFSPWGTSSHLCFWDGQSPSHMTCCWLSPKEASAKNKPGTSWALLITSLLMSYGIYSTISLCLRQSRGPSRLKRKGPRFHLPAGVLQSRKKRLWDGSSTWSESGCQGGNAEFPHHYPENGILMSLYNLLTKLSWPCPNNGKSVESHITENIIGAKHLDLKSLLKQWNLWLRNKAHCQYGFWQGSHR